MMSSYRRILMFGAATMVALGGWGLAYAADDAKPDAPKAEVKEEPKTDAATPAASAAIDTASLPAYWKAESPKDENGKVIKELYPDPKGDNSGALITPAADGKGDKNPESLTKTDLYDRIAHNMWSINIVWTLITGFLVMFMQAGFALVETGLCRAKNAAHTMSMNFMIYALGCTAFWVYGFGIGWGNWYNGPVGPGWVPTLGPGTSVLNSGIGIGPTLDDKEKPTGAYRWGLLGTKGFFLKDVDDTGVMALFFFMMVFFDTTATIPTGVLAERWAWKSFLLYGFWVALPYCIYANWVWGGGWLAQLGVNWGWGHGAVDFAGSGVVHGMGGAIGLAGGYVLGPRIGKYKDGKPQPIPAHHIPMVILGTFILAFGWFGFNPGSTLAGTDLRISTVVVNTMLASIAAPLSAHLTMHLKGLKPDPSMLCNGMLAGLVAITAPCAFVDAWGAFVIGGVAGSLVVFSVFFWEKIGIDDVVGAISVHGVNGLWGVLSVGIFANGKYGVGWNGVDNGVRGILYGDPGQLAAQVFDCCILIIVGVGLGFALFKLSELITPIRVSKETEMVGLDGPEMGSHGYPDFTMVNR